MKISRPIKIMTMCLVLICIVLSMAGCGNHRGVKSAYRDTDTGMSYGVVANGVDSYVDDSGFSNDAAEESDSYASQLKHTDSQEKIVKTYDLSVETEKFDRYVNAVQKRIKDFQGYTEQSDINDYGYSSYSNRNAVIVARIPSANVNEFLSGLDIDGVITHRSENATNVTMQYVDLESRINAYKTEQATLLDLLKKAENLTDTMQIHERLNEVNYQIENYTSQLRVLENRVSYSTVTIDVDEVQRALAESDSLGNRIKVRFLENWDRFVEGGKSLIVSFIGGLPILIPVCGLFAVIILLSMKMCKKRRLCRKHVPAKRQDVKVVAGPEDLVKTVDNGADQLNADDHDSLNCLK